MKNFELKVNIFNMVYTTLTAGVQPPLSNKVLYMLGGLLNNVCELIFPTKAMNFPKSVTK